MKIDAVDVRFEINHPIGTEPRLIFEDPNSITLFKKQDGTWRLDALSQYTPGGIPHRACEKTTVTEGWVYKDYIKEDGITTAIGRRARRQGEYGIGREMNPGEVEKLDAFQVQQANQTPLRQP